MERSDKRTIELAFEIGAPIEEVWRALDRRRANHTLALTEGSGRTRRRWTHMGLLGRGNEWREPNSDVGDHLHAYGANG